MVLVESFSGIRGIYKKELTDEVAVRYAYAFSEFLDKEKKRIVIGRDTRKSGENLRKALIEGLDSDIIDVGVLPTPAIQNAVRHFKADAGIIITASHNEPEFNGFKFLDIDGAVLRPKSIEKVINNFHELNSLDEESFLSKHLYKEKGMKHVKRVEKRHLESLNSYKKFVLHFFKKTKFPNLTFTVDSNGGSGTIIKEILKELNINAHYINMEQGDFKRTIEPKEDSLKKTLKHSKGDFLAGFDCDADRVEIMLKDGTLVSGNHLLALVVDDILSELKQPEKETVVVNDATSYLVKDVVHSYNANWKEVEVGEINVVDTMIAFNSPVGGEGSNGGIIVPKSRCRDGILTILFILKIIQKKGKSLKELIEEFEEYYYIKEKVKLKQDFTKIREKIKKHYLGNHFIIEETGDDTGGLKAIKDNSWIWFRQSKTEDKALRIIVDSKDEKMAKEFLREGIKLTKK